MNSDRKADYYVGLDMGTGSLGVAVTDPQYHLLKVKGKDFWFVREYETAHPQLERRTHRISKRRLQRHQVRIGLIRSYFADDVLEHDPLFYIRQDNSKYYREDKDSRLLTKDSLFAEPNYGDKEYYKEYPTVFHLRQALLKDEISSEERYSRLLYLAIINMFEYRGHFLLNTDSGDVNFEMVKDAGETVMNYLYDSMEESTAKISYVKARNVSGFRKQSFLKSRLVNEHHHAKDAYLNIVVGNVYYTKFTRNPMNFIKNEVQRSSNKYNYNLSKMFENDVVRNGEIAWSVQKNHKPGTMQVVSEVMCKNTPLITRQAFEQKGELFNIQPVGKYSAKAGNYVPLKVKDTKLQNVEKYGGYTSLKPAYFTFIEHGSEKKRKRCFEVVQSYYASQIKKESDLIEFLEKNGYKNPRVIAGKIKKNSLIKYNGYLLYVIGMDARKNIEFSNATPMCLENKYIQYVSKLEKAYNEIILSERKKTEPRLSEKVTIENNLKLYRELTDKHVNSIYRNHPRSIGDILEKGEDKFESLDLVHQIKILYNLVLYTSFNRGTFSLTDIGGPKEVGRIRISGNMTEAKELKLIHYSVTGLYKKEIDLLNQ